MENITLVTFVALSFACAFISYTITKSMFFESFRDFFFNRAHNYTASGRRYLFFHNLVTCPYCFSHWVAIIMVMIWQPRFTNCGIKHLWILDYIISVFMIVGLSSYLWGTFSRITQNNKE